MIEREEFYTRGVDTIMPDPDIDVYMKVRKKTSTSAKIHIREFDQWPTFTGYTVFFTSKFVTLFCLPSNFITLISPFIFFLTNYSLVALGSYETFLTDFYHVILMFVVNFPTDCSSDLFLSCIFVVNFMDTWFFFFKFHSKALAIWMNQIQRHNWA